MDEKPYTPRPPAPWSAGQSANPGGRPKKTDEMREAEALARKNSPAAIRRLVALMESKDPNAAIKAANSILDRAFGRPAQAITGPDGDPLVAQVVDWSKVTDEQLRALASIAAAMATPSGGDRGGAGGTPAPGV